METGKCENTYLPEGYSIYTDRNTYYTSSLRTLEAARQKGKILEGTVTLCDCTDMSLHIDFGFAEGIIYKEESVFQGDNIKDIAVITRVGKPVCFKVLEIIPASPRPKIILSRRLAQMECYENRIEKLSCGDIIPACVTHLDSFGAFVDIGCGIVSLVCIDCISVSRIFHPSDRMYVGQKIYAAVKSIDRENARVFMTTRELLGTWEENAAEFAAGTTVSGIVRSVEEYGIFVELAPNLAGLSETREGVFAGDICSVYIKSIIPQRMKIKLVIIDSRSGTIRPPREMKYFIDPQKTSHIDRWTYSPSGCVKTVETDFCNLQRAEYK